MTKYIAFKRAKNTLLYQEIKNQMPGEYIIEYHDTSKFPKGYFKTSNGWEIENSEYFEKEYNKNQDIINNFKQQLHDLTVEQKATLKQKAQEEYIADKEEYKIWLEFKEWKKKMGHQAFLKQINRNY